MKALRLDRVAINVADLGASEAFYAGALGFAAEAARDEDGQLAGLLGVHAVRSLLMRRGGQTVELTQTDPPGAPYPADGASNDIWFQHCALATRDMARDYARLGGFAAAPISRSGPQKLPGGIVAYKFRDPDGHPLELIGFPEPYPITQNGIDHSAIAVADVERSIAFYHDHLGLRVAARQVNTGPAQDALDGLVDAQVDVIALCPADPAPHVELLGYRRPRGRVAQAAAWSDLAASRLVFTVDGLPGAEDQRQLFHDPDGHAVLLAGASQTSARVSPG